jgi:putative aldouronate transport system substrate-binding protein
MKLKKFTLIGLVIILFISAIFFTACRKDDDGNIDEQVEPLKETTVKIALRADSGQPDDYLKVQEAINKRLRDDDKPYNIAFEFLAVTDYISKIETKGKNENLDAAFVYIDEYANLLERKTLKNIKAILDERGKTLYAKSSDYSWKQVSSKDGSSVYAMPRHVPMASYEDTIAVRGDWMQIAGISNINSINDYYQYANFIQNQDGIGKGKDILGNNIEAFYASAAEHNNTFMLRELAPSYFFPIKDYALRPIYIDIAEGMLTGNYTVKNFYASSVGEETVFQKWSSKARTLVDAGYAPAGGPSSVSNPDYNFNNDRLGSLWNVTLKQSERIDTFKENASKANVANAPDPAIYDVLLNSSVEKYVMVGADNMMAVMSNSKNANEVVDFFNWIKSSQDNYDLFCYGIEGVHYYGSTKKIEGTDYEVKYISYKKEGSPTIQPKMRYADKMPYWAITDIDMMRWSTNLSDEYIISRLEWEKVDANGKANYIVSPLVGFNLDYSSLEFKTAKMNVMASTGFAAEFATGKAHLNELVGSTSETKYQQLIAKVKEAGIEKMITEIQKQINDYLS